MDYFEIRTKNIVEIIVVVMGLILLFFLWVANLNEFPHVVVFPILGVYVARSLYQGQRTIIVSNTNVEQSKFFKRERFFYADVKEIVVKEASFADKKGIFGMFKTYENNYGYSYNFICHDGRISDIPERFVGRDLHRFILDKAEEHNVPFRDFRERSSTQKETV